MAKPQNKIIRIMAKRPGFRRFGRAWSANPALVIVSDDAEKKRSPGGGFDWAITPAELKRLNKEARASGKEYPLHVTDPDALDIEMHKQSAALENARELTEGESKRLTALKAEREAAEKELDRLLAQQTLLERKLAEAEDRAQRAEKAAADAEERLQKAKEQLEKAQQQRKR